MAASEDPGNQYEVYKLDAVIENAYEEAEATKQEGSTRTRTGTFISKFPYQPIGIACEPLFKFLRIKFGRPCVG